MKKTDNIQSYFLGIPSWTIQDQTYPDLHKGDVHDVFLEISPHYMCLKEDSPKQLRHLGNCYYQIDAECVAISPAGFLIDSVFPIACQAPPVPGLKVGRSLRIEAYLGLGLPGTEELLNMFSLRDEFVCEITINSIQRDSRHWKRFLNEENSLIVPGRKLVNPNARVKQPEKGSAEKVECTNGLVDDDGIAHYILGCKVRRHHSDV